MSRSTPTNEQIIFRSYLISSQHLAMTYLDGLVSVRTWLMDGYYGQPAGLYPWLQFLRTPNHKLNACYVSGCRVPVHVDNE